MYGSSSAAAAAAAAASLQQQLAHEHRHLQEEDQLPLGHPGAYYATQGSQSDAMQQYYTTHAHHAHQQYLYPAGGGAGELEEQSASGSTSSSSAGPLEAAAAAASRRGHLLHHHHHHHLASTAAHHHHHNLLQHQQAHQLQLQQLAGARCATKSAAAPNLRADSSGAGSWSSRLPLCSAAGRSLRSLANRCCCSKRCLFITCLCFILMIFIFVIGLSAYLNFLINLNKINLIPLSGRLRVEQPGDSYQQQLANKTSKEFLQKQQQYEFILRGAFDRTQVMLKSYPNHLVKCEVYSFKPGSLWVYFRLFLNKSSLLHDLQLMKRKSPDEQMDKQFLPRLTQQTLHSGFQQLMQLHSANSNAPLISNARRPTRSNNQTTTTTTGASQPVAQRQRLQKESVKSFDDQIGRLMPIIEAIDLQTIQVTAEFDMLQLTEPLDGLEGSLAMSDNLRASQFFTTPPSIMVATGGSVQEAPKQALAEYELATGGSSSPAPARVEASSSRPPVELSDEISVSTKKFTLVGYKDNATRPAVVQSQPEPAESPFLVRHQQRKPSTSSTTTSTTSSTTTTSTAGPFALDQNQRLLVVSRAPVTNSHSPPTLPPPPPPTPLVQSTRKPVDVVTISFNSTSQAPPPSTRRPQPVVNSVEELWNSAIGNATARSDPARRPAGVGAARSDKLQQVAASQRPDDWQKVSVLSAELTNEIRSQLTAAAATTPASPSSTAASGQVSAPKPKVAPHLHQGGSLRSSWPQQPQKSPSSSADSAVLLSRDFLSQQPAGSSNNSNNEQVQRSNKPTVDRQQRKPANQQVTTGSGSAARVMVSSQKQANESALGTTGSPATSRPRIVQPKSNKVAKVKKIGIQEVKNDTSTPSSSLREQPAQTNGTLVNSKGIRIVDNFLAALDSSLQVAGAPARLQVNLTAPARQTSSAAARDKGAQVRQQEAPAAEPTPPTTIELTRSTSGPAPTPTRPLQEQSGLRAAASADFSVTTARYEPATSTPSPSRPAAGQWRPITTTVASAEEPPRPASGARPPANMALIVGEQPAVLVNVPSSGAGGSQSPFAMSAMQASLAAGGQRPRARAGNRYHQQADHAFESHRMSRMRQSLQEAQAVRAQASTTSSSLLSSSHFVDDFMVTSTAPDGGLRGSPLALQPLVVSDLVPTSADLGQTRRTRGPFAFESLSQQQRLLAPGTRAERSSGAESKLLTRKHLFLADPEPPAADLSEAGDQSSRGLFGSRQSPLARAREQQVATKVCHYYGCKSKLEPLRYICLNVSQICDDFVHCQDQSDELDCVSLLKHDTKTNRLTFSNGEGIIYLNRRGSLAPMCIDHIPALQANANGSRNHLELGADLAAANGIAGDTLPVAANPPPDQASRHQELIKQINNIGHYACSLQSFNRLVSVKINHHSQVDQFNQIKDSNLFHRLSIISAPGDERRDQSLYDSASMSATSSDQQHEVEVSSSSECPSQRTVFVKCGDFECGQDSFSVLTDQQQQKQQQRRRNNNLARRRVGDGVIINDFPWLVKLFWRNELTCHGYLIDELWLIAASDCFLPPRANRTNGSDYDESDRSDASGWAAEISHEHYGNLDYQSIETNRRSIQEILVQPVSEPSRPAAIVLAKLERPVRFSPLNRPICLPQSLNGHEKQQFAAQPGLGEIFGDCVTATLPSPTNSGANSSQPPTPQTMILNRAIVSRKPIDCLDNNGSIADLTLDGFVCAADNSSQPKPLAGDRLGVHDDADDLTRVLICSTSQNSQQSRSSWTVVGVQSRLPTQEGSDFRLLAKRHLYQTVSSQMDWIVDTMNPKSYPNSNPQANNSSSGIELNPKSINQIQLQQADTTNLNQQQQTCNRFKCSSGECLSWSRICDGLYDCSSQDDEKDCHK